jgi:serine/threonine protein kinase
MKILRKDRIEQKQQRLYTKNERDILVMLSHPFTVRLYYAFQTPVKLYLIMDFVEGGELFYHLAKVKRVDEMTAQFYAAEILLTLEYLHSIKIIYRYSISLT